MKVFASESWIQVNGEDVLCIHPDYRGFLAYVVGRTAVFSRVILDGNSKGDVFLELSNDIEDYIDMGNFIGEGISTM